ncbi:hypothetical protein VHEMI00305 [[Torrubiella] hemipterigena]|uniref:Protein kinase domain-containing protein n=1 Tax=[Torrubiella] hemipterigena TaxID=1531966 RepID=A0A0A1T1X6_9HYPO|nr:hypothetical protein VHEMI00305 [[Torrubiella] hemipterigena]
MEPTSMSLRSLQEIQRTRVFHESVVRGGMSQLLLGLDYLHEADIIHADLHSDNLLIALKDQTILEELEDDEITSPSARKIIANNTIHTSHFVLGGFGALIISDFGQAGLGERHSGNAMPVPYRAPEIILGLEWGSSIDIWATGVLAWSLFHQESLFTIYDQTSTEMNDAHHLAYITALLGPRPLQLLQKTDKTKQYWDSTGQWVGPVPLPDD